MVLRRRSPRGPQRRHELVRVGREHRSHDGVSVQPPVGSELEHFGTWRRGSGRHRALADPLVQYRTGAKRASPQARSNTPTGELLAIEATNGELRYRHLLGTVLETDIPRRLEPVLRSGALFVPHSNVHVFRPREAIPDLLRVDERCDVYVAEESGHLVSFAAGPRLSLVKG